MRKKLRLYWQLIKSLQTLLLLVTGLAGYLSAQCPMKHWAVLLSVAGSLFLAISGSTVLNMWYDRYIDSRMSRACRRPLPSGQVDPHEALALGITLSILGVGWALAVGWLYGTLVFAGLFFDVIIYTVWLKRRTAWSIVWGGIAGGMPVLAGRALGVGRIEWVGVLMAAAVLLWIPTHIMTYNIRYAGDYRRAGVPTFPSAYGIGTTRRVIAISSLLAAISMGLAAYGIRIPVNCLYVMILLSGGLLFLVVKLALKPTEKTNFALFKYASLYMLGSMLMMGAAAF